MVTVFFCGLDKCNPYCLRMLFYFFFKYFLHFLPIKCREHFSFLHLEQSSAAGSPSNSEDTLQFKVSKICTMPLLPSYLYFMWNTVQQQDESDYNSDLFDLLSSFWAPKLIAEGKVSGVCIPIWEDRGVILILRVPLYGLVVLCCLPAAASAAFPSSLTRSAWSSFNTLNN